MYKVNIESLGFTKEDYMAIEDHFLCSLNIEDLESMLIFEDDTAIFKYLFIDNEDKESIANTLLEMGEIKVENLNDGQSLMEHMIETDENRFKLPNGKWIIFSEELLHKERLAQID